MDSHFSVNCHIFTTAKRQMSALDTQILLAQNAQNFSSDVLDPNGIVSFVTRLIVDACSARLPALPLLIWTYSRICRMFWTVREARWLAIKARHCLGSPTSYLPYLIKIVSYTRRIFECAHLLCVSATRGECPIVLTRHKGPARTRMCTRGLHLCARLLTSRKPF